MLRLLIVDNERLIVESLLDLFDRTDRIELEVYGAYSSVEALRLLDRTKIDIVLSDIRMPGMDGLELQREIVKKWPWCKVIFLTGYDDFEYIHQALRHGGLDYLLKSEGHDVIVHTVEKAAKQLYDSVEANRLIAVAERQVQLTRPLLQKDYLMELLQGEPSALRKMDTRFEELQLPLRSKEDFVAVLGRIDDWRDDFTVPDKDLMRYAVQNIAEEYFSKSLTCVTVIFENHKFLWLLQPISEDGAKVAEESWKQTIRFIQGTTETIQMACKHVLKLSISFAVGTEVKSWASAPEQFHALKRLLNRGIGMDKELILLDRDMNENDEFPQQVHTLKVRSQLDKLSSMTVFLDNGQSPLFFEEYAKLTDLASGAGAAEESLKLEIYYSLVALFLSYINRWGLLIQLGEKIDLGKLTKYDLHRSWEEIVDYFKALAEALFEQKLTDQLYREGDLIKHIQLYIEHNLAGDLSLTRIGEVVGYNPYYLTRLYKQITNEGLTDYIANARLMKAKILLAQNQLIVQDISKAVGFMTEQSFYRFFKKATNLTPHEYRDLKAISKKDNGK
jgi:two-component system response regulator YesN